MLTAPAAAATRTRWEGLRYCLLVFVAVRAALLVIGVIGSAALTRAAEIRGTIPYVPGLHNAYDAYVRWDSGFYLRIAGHGYTSDDGAAAFFPLYPTLVHGVGFLTGGHLVLAAFLVSNLAGLAALFVVYRLTAWEFDPSFARRTVVVLSVFPTGYFLFAPYSEPLFLLLSVGCLFAARRGSWWVAAALGLLAATTRSAGLLLCLPLLLEGYLQARETRGRLRDEAPAAAAAGATGCGALLYLAYWQVRAGSWHLPLDVQQHFWKRHAAWPWVTLVDGLRKAPSDLFRAWDVAFVLLALVATVWVVRTLRPTYGLYYVTSLLFPLSVENDDRPLLSMPRFVLVALPLIWALVVLGRTKRVQWAVVLTSAAGMLASVLAFVAYYPVY